MGENGGQNMVMPVAPFYGNGGNGGFGFGGDGGWLFIILLLALCGGWGNNGGGIFGGGFGNNDIYPWMNNSNQIHDGFRDQMINDNITGIKDAIVGIGTQLNTNQMATLERSFAVQSALQNCCCENRAGLADLKYTVATENCADRTQSLMNTRDIIESQTRGTQAILDKLCTLEMDAYKRENANLRDQLNMATLRESQTAQNALIAQGFSNEVDALYNRLSNCPVPSTPVYGRTPIFTCPNNGCGCGAM